MLLCSYYWFISGIMSKLHKIGPISGFRKIKNPHLQCVGWNLVLNANYFEVFLKLLNSNFRNTSGHQNFQTNILEIFPSTNVNISRWEGEIFLATKIFNDYLRNDVKPI